MNEQVEIEVRSTKPMTSYVYEVLGRGNIVFAQTVQANGQTNHTFKFPCLLDMAPRARVLVYFTTDNGEVVADSIVFEADGTFQNKVTLSYMKLCANAVRVSGLFSFFSLLIIVLLFPLSRYRFYSLYRKGPFLRGVISSS